MNIRLVFSAILLPLVSFHVHAKSPKALPVDATPTTDAHVALPATLNAVTFDVDAEGDKHTLTVTASPTLVRIDEPTDRLTVIYDPRTEHYIGLEHDNYTWWDFSWPEVRDAVQSSKRFEERLRDVGTLAMSVDPNATSPGTDTNTPPPSTSASPGGDDSGYVWHATTDKKRIAGLDCVRWTGETLSGLNIEAWCASGLIPPVQTAVATLRAVNEPMALVPVRNFVPPLVFVAWDALTKGGVTPVLLTWGDSTDHNRFALVSNKSRDGKPSLFEVPKMYMKTTLVTMDGIGNQKMEEPHRGQPKTPSLKQDSDSALP